MSNASSNTATKITETIVSVEKISNDKNEITKLITETGRVLEVHGGGDWYRNSKENPIVISVMAILTLGPSDNSPIDKQSNKFVLFLIESRKGVITHSGDPGNFVIGIHCLMLNRVEGDLWDVGYSSALRIGTTFPSGTVVTNYNVVNCASSSVLCMTVRKPNNEQAGVVYTYVSPCSNVVCYDFGDLTPPVFFNQETSFATTAPQFKDTSSSTEEIKPTSVYELTVAYEHGVGKGYEAIVTNKEIPNPYTEGDYASAWGYGYNQGKRVSLKPKLQM